MPEPAAGVNFAAAALGKCPVCGRGRLFRSWLKVADACDVCGTPFKTAEAGDGPVVFVILIAGFLACVGLMAGGKFFETVFTGEGLHWLFAGLAITIVPLLFVALAARFLLKLNSQTISGVLAGSMTDPPALAFAHAINVSDAPLVAYAAVYPLSMLLRIFTAQILVVIFCR